MKVGKQIAFVLAPIVTATSVYALTSPPVDLAITVIPAPSGFYVATNGNDNNTGTLASPFATLTKCQSAMQTSATKACYIRAGTYAPLLSSGCPSWITGGKVGIVCMRGTTDSGETWAEYPLDGCDTAVIDGQSTANGNGFYTIFDITGTSGNNGPSNLTFNCLTMENFQFGALAVSGSSFNTPGPANMTISNNVIRNGTQPGGSGGPTGQGGILCYGCSNMLVSHNAISDMQGMGTQVVSTASNSISGLTVTGNVVYNTCMGTTDCGGIYQQDLNYVSTGITITNNYVRDANPSTNGSGGSGIGSAIYLDDCLSNTTVSGNVITGMSGSATTQLHGGKNNTYSGNVIDLTGYGRYIGQYTTSNACAGLGGANSPMTGNSYIGNIIIGAGGGGGYFGGGLSASTMPTIGGSGVGQANDYYNYGGSAISSAGLSELTVNDTNPQNINPQFNGCYNIAPGSPVFSSPINFPPIVGGWGPLGFTIPPASGPSVPSYPSPTC